MALPTHVDRCSGTRAQDAGPALRGGPAARRDGRRRRRVVDETAGRDRLEGYRTIELPGVSTRGARADPVGDPVGRAPMAESESFHRLAIVNRGEAAMR